MLSIKISDIENLKIDGDVSSEIDVVIPTRSVLQSSPVERQRGGAALASSFPVPDRFPTVCKYILILYIVVLLIILYTNNSCVKEVASSPLLAIPITNVTGWLATGSQESPCHF